MAKVLGCLADLCEKVGKRRTSKFKQLKTWIKVGKQKEKVGQKYELWQHLRYLNIHGKTRKF